MTNAGSSIYADVDEDAKVEIYIAYLQEASIAMRRVLDALYAKHGIKRGLFYRLAMLRADSIIMSHLVKEINQRGEKERERISKEHGSDLPRQTES